MTVEEAKAIIYGNVVYACEKAGFSPHTVKLVQDACDTIIDLADRKTENSSEKPNNCDTCKHWWKSEEVCLLDDCQYEPKTEPTISKMEQVDEPQTYITEDRDTQVLDAWQIHHRNTTSVVEDEPQTDCN